VIVHDAMRARAKDRTDIENAGGKARFVLRRIGRQRPCGGSPTRRGDVDILVNNAGITGSPDLRDHGRRHRRSHQHQT